MFTAGCSPAAPASAISLVDSSAWHSRTTTPLANSGAACPSAPLASRSMARGRGSDHHEAVQSRFRQPDLARTAEDLAHARALLRGGIASERFGRGVEGHDCVGAPVRHPDDVAVIDINRVGPRPLAGQFPLTPAVRLGIIKTELTRAPLRYPDPAFGVGPYPPRALSLARRLDHGRGAGHLIDPSDVIP